MGKMTNSQKIQSILADGHFAVVKNLMNRRCWVCFYDDGGGFITSDRGYSTKGALESGSNLYSYRYIDSLSLKITALPRKPRILKAGDYVKVLKIARECGDDDVWSNFSKKMVGGFYRISKIYYDYSGVRYGINSKTADLTYNFPSYCVRKAFPEEIKKPKERKVIVTMQQIADKFNVKDVKNLIVKK